MTEEEQGGTAPQPEATASAPDEAPEQTAAAVAVADEPATTEDVTPDASETPGAVETAEDIGLLWRRLAVGHAIGLDRSRPARLGSFDGG